MIRLHDVVKYINEIDRDPSVNNLSIENWNGEQINIWLHFGSQYVRIDEYFKNKNNYPQLRHLKRIIFGDG